MKLRRTIAATTAGLALAGASLAVSPASAVDPETTAVSLTVTATGALAISVPEPTAPATAIDLGSVAAGSAPTPTNNLGTVTVTDTRTGLLENTWAMSVKSTNLVLDGAAANDLVVGKFIPAAALGYTVGAVTEVVPQALDPVVTNPVALSELVASQVVLNVAIGPNTLSWNPKLVATVLPNTLPGAYKGTVTHSIL